MIVMGIDPSKTCTGVVVLHDSTPNHWGKFAFSAAQKKTDSDDLTDGMNKARQISKYLQSWKPDLAVIEGYAYSNTHNLAVLVTIQTCIRIALRANEIPYLVVAPTQLTKFVVPGSKRKKEDVKLHAYKKWAFEDESNDIVDAYCLAQVGWAWKKKTEKVLKLSKPQTEVVNKLTPAWLT